MYNTVSIIEPFYFGSGAHHGTGLAPCLFTLHKTFSLAQCAILKQQQQQQQQQFMPSPLLSLIRELLLPSQRPFCFLV